MTGTLCSALPLRTGAPQDRSPPGRPRTAAPSPLLPGRGRWGAAGWAPLAQGTPCSSAGAGQGPPREIKRSIRRCPARTRRAPPPPARSFGAGADRRPLVPPPRAPPARVPAPRPRDPRGGGAGRFVLPYRCAAPPRSHATAAVTCGAGVGGASRGAGRSTRKRRRWPSGPGRSRPGPGAAGAEEPSPGLPRDAAGPMANGAAPPGRVSEAEAGPGAAPPPAPRALGLLPTAGGPPRAGEGGRR